MPATPVRLITSSPAATDVVAAMVARACRPGDVVVLAGEMGAGKTSFAKGFGAALGVTEPITSPTFTLVQTYETTWPGDTPWSGRPLLLHHADIYRLDQLSEVADLAFGELAEFGGVLLVEWGDVVAATLGDHLLVRLDPVDDEDHSSDDDASTETRRITVAPVGAAWASRWERLAGDLSAAGSSPTSACQAAAGAPRGPAPEGEAPC